MQYPFYLLTQCTIWLHIFLCPFSSSARVGAPTDISSWPPKCWELAAQKFDAFDASVSFLFFCSSIVFQLTDWLYVCTLHLFFIWHFFLETLYFFAAMGGKCDHRWNWGGLPDDYYSKLAVCLLDKGRLWGRSREMLIYYSCQITTPILPKLLFQCMHIGKLCKQSQRHSTYRQ